MTDDETHETPVFGTVIDFNNARPQGSFPARELNAEVIRDRLSQAAESFVQWLFAGRALISRGHARVGDVFGTPGSSLHITLTGADAGMWMDHATKECGDLITLYRACMGYTANNDFVLSLQEIARDFFGDPIEVDRPTWRAKPVEVIESLRAKLGTKPRADMLELGAPVATYRYYDTHGNILASVVRYEPDGTRKGKTFRPWHMQGIKGGPLKWTAGAPALRPLYRIPQIAVARSVVLVEGEGVADALADVGIEATSAMQGANAPIDRTDWSPLTGTGKEIIIWPDNDEPGRAYAAAVAIRLSQLDCKVRVVQVPDGKPVGWDARDCIDDGIDPKELLGAAVELGEPGATLPPGTTFELFDLEQLEAMPRPKYLIAGLIVEQALGFVYGKPGALKTFIVLDMFLSLAARFAQWWGRTIEQHGPVIYISCEGYYADIAPRAKAWKRKHGIAGKLPFWLLYESVNFMDQKDIDRLLLTVQAIADKHGQICAIGVDTVSRVLPGAEENLQKEMTMFVKACDTLRQRFKTVVVGVHHANKSGEEMRGSTVLTGAGDFVLQVNRDPGAMHGSIFAEKIKSAEDGWKLHFAAEAVALDDSLVGEKSLVLSPLDAKEKQKLEEDDTPSLHICKEILAGIDEQWRKGVPWCFAPNNSRSAVTNISERWRLKPAMVKRLLAKWVAAKEPMIEEAVRDTHTHIRGYRKLADFDS